MNIVTGKEGPFAMTPDLLSALKLALPYVQKVAATAPTEYGRMQRQMQAVKDVRAIQEAISKAVEWAP